MKLLILLILSFVCSFCLGLLWWNLWMNHGFIGTPNFLASTLSADGEGVYDLMQLEMIAIIQITFVALIIAFKKKLKL